MTRFKEIEGAAEFVEMLTADFDVLESSIVELEKRQEELENKLDKSDKRFTVESLKTNGQTRQELNIIKQALIEARGELTSLELKTDETIVKDASKVIINHRDKVKGSYGHINKEIIEKIHEIRELYKQLKAHERKERRQVYDFIQEIDAYLPEEPIMPMNEMPYQHLMRLINGNNNNYLDVVDPEVYGIPNGLYELDWRNVPTSKQGKIQAINKKYGIGIDEI